VEQISVCMRRSGVRNFNSSTFGCFELILGLKHSAVEMVNVANSAPRSLHKDEFYGYTSKKFINFLLFTALATLTDIP